MKNKHLQNKKKSIKLILITSFLMIFWLFGCTLPTPSPSPSPTPSSDLKEGELKVHFIYVDQGDCILLELPNGEVAMIDCGIGLYDGTTSIENIQNYLRGEEITKIDYTIISHPHNDHMGAYYAIASEFQMYDVYTTPKTHTTYAYTNFLSTIRSLSGNLYFPKPGEYIIRDFDYDLSLQAISVIEEDDNLNNCSLVVRLIYKNNSFLFTGDAEIVGEKAIVDSAYDCRADVLKVAHHGSKNSSTQYLLDEVGAKYGILTTTKNVSGTGHPHAAAVNRLLKAGIDLYETGVYENIIIACDGDNYQFSALSLTGELTSDLEPSRRA